MSVDRWLARLDASDDSAWTELLSVATSHARRMRSADPSGLAANFVGEQVLCGARSARSADPATPLAAWVRGCIRNHVRRERATARRARSLTAVDEPSAAEDACVDDANVRVARADLRSRVVARLTQCQRDAYACHVEGLSERDAATRLGVSRDCYRDRRDRALANLRRAVPSRAWAHAAAASFAMQGDALAARVLAMHARGATHAEIATATALTYSAVRDRIGRLRRKLSPSGAR